MGLISVSHTTRFPWHANEVREVFEVAVARARGPMGTWLRSVWQTVRFIWQCYAVLVEPAWFATEVSTSLD